MDATELRLELKVCSLDPVSTLLQHTQTELKLKSCKHYYLLHPVSSLKLLSTL